MDELTSTKGDKRLSAAEVDICPLCGWATGADGLSPTICPYHDARCERITVRIPAAVSPEGAYEICAKQERVRLELEHEAALFARSAERWAKSTPRSTLLYVVGEAREFSDPDRVAAAEAELARRDPLAAPERTDSKP